MIKFWPNLSEAAKALGGTGYTEHALVADGRKRWLKHSRTATVHDTPHGDVELRRVNYYGWRKK